MKSMHWILFVLAVATVAPALAADRDVPGALRPYMTAEEFRAAGLHKLNPAELAQFQAWFVRTVGDPQEPARRAPGAAEPGAPGPAPARTVERTADPEVSLFGLERLQSDAREITATLVGRFAGWETGTRFELDNGQVWEVFDTGDYHVPRPVDAPRVTIKRGVSDSYHFNVEGYNRSARVRRID